MFRLTDLHQAEFKALYAAVIEENRRRMQVEASDINLTRDEIAMLQNVGKATTLLRLHRRLGIGHQLAQQVINRYWFWMEDNSNGRE